MSADLYVSPRQNIEPVSTGEGALNHSLSVDKVKVATSPVAYLPESGQIARLLSTNQVPNGVVREGRWFMTKLFLSFFNNSRSDYTDSHHIG